MQLRQRIETEAQGKATAVFQAELARGQAMLQYQIELRRDGQVSQEGEEEGEDDGEDDGEADEDGRRRRGRPRKYVLNPS